MLGLYVVPSKQVAKAASDSACLAGPQGCCSGKSHASKSSDWDPVSWLQITMPPPCGTTLPESTQVDASQGGIVALQLVLLGVFWSIDRHNYTLTGVSHFDWCGPNTSHICTRHLSCGTAFFIFFFHRSGFNEKFYSFPNLSFSVNKQCLVPEECVP